MEKELQKKRPEDNTDRRDPKGKKKDASLTVVLFSALALVLCMMLGIYLMIFMPEMLPAIAVAGLAALGCTYLCVATLVKRVEKKEAEQQEQYASILKSEKASYLLIRKYFDEISEQLSLMEDRLAGPFQEVIAAQKATAKVTISRNKENADALMNSNDKLLEQFFQMESRLDEISEAMSSGTEDKNEELLRRQIEMTNQLSGQLREAELELKNEILQAVNKISMTPQPVVMPMAAQPQMMMPDPLPDLTEEPEPLPDITEEPEPLPDITEEPEPLPDIMEEPEPLPDTTEEPEPLPDLMEEPESVEAEDEPVVDTELEPLMPEEPELLPEPEAEPEPEPEIESAAESAAEPEAEPEIEELPPEPDLSDPNKMMSPDDIAALLASINSEAAAEPEVVADEVAADIPDEPVGQPEVLDTQIVSEPEQETATDASPMPDLSDPNKVMSPDEIAALFANLG